jgi:hypothetical protein
VTDAHEQDHQPIDRLQETQLSALVAALAANRRSR